MHREKKNWGTEKRLEKREYKRTTKLAPTWKEAMEKFSRKDH